MPVSHSLLFGSLRCSARCPIFCAYLHQGGEAQYGESSRAFGPRFSSGNLALRRRLNKSRLVFFFLGHPWNGRGLGASASPDRLDGKYDGPGHLIFKKILACKGSSPPPCARAGKASARRGALASPAISFAPACPGTCRSRARRAIMPRSRSRRLQGMEAVAAAQRLLTRPPSPPSPAAWPCSPQMHPATSRATACRGSTAGM